MASWQLRERLRFETTYLRITENMLFPSLWMREVRTSLLELAVVRRLVALLL